MQTYSIYYESALTFHLLPTDEINSAKSLFIQLFSGQISETMLEKVLREIKIFFPKAVVVGVTTDGEIKNEAVSTYKTLITITTFQKSKITSFAIENISEETACQAGELLAKKVARRDTKFLLLYTDGLKFNADTLSRGFSRESRDLPFCGLIAADNGKFFETFVLHDDRILRSGAVAVAFSGKELEVAIELFEELEMVGPKMRVTKASGNVVERIEGIPAATLYRNYLGEEFVRRLPRSGTDISLVVEEGSEYSARQATALYEDGSIRYTGDVPEGSLCRFGYLDSDQLALSSCCLPEFPSDSKIETIQVFADSARRRVTGNLLRRQIEHFCKEAEVIGVCGYGEIIGKESRYRLLNQAMVVVAFGEKESEKFEDGMTERCMPCQLPILEEETLLRKGLAHLTSQMLEQMQVKEEALRVLMNEVPYGILLYDEDLQLQHCNAMAERLLGIELKLGGSRDLTLLDRWIVSLFQDGLKSEKLIKVGRLFDPLAGEDITLRISTVGIVSEGRVCGAMAIVQKDG
ncbi:FIST N-terminal domain-containing protein [Hydrogenimonas cancrithermarum]|uniref:PAS domain-containing protein n=1 Tax=Hydrogenimonas cancrithermarum TaxID=2993563 RepID=A0ABM8FKW8_9BACT|nr:FIST N-terminal domain-containing protein [Hydrogenimonas cancrithermarum]BDY12023.1 hypothetical protein HCR_03350 [Hydrogenimonas cancrithermarum]